MQNGVQQDDQMYALTVIILESYWKILFQFFGRACAC